MITARWIAAFLVFGLSLRAATITLLWDYPTNDLGADLTFKVYSTTNIAVPMTNWQVSTIVGTTTAAQVTMAPSRRFFFVTASNIWGESGPSNITNTPAPVTNVIGLKLTKP